MVEDNNQTQPESGWDEFSERTLRRWPLLLLYVLLAVVVAVLVVFGGRAIYRHYHKPAIKTVPASTKNLPPEPSPSGSSGSKKTVEGSSGSNKKNQTAGSTKTLPNSGPGDVLDIFAASVLIAGGAHYVVTSRR